MTRLPLLRVAVVGHTNTGKTSLLRTLLRDPAFGEVSDRPGTTRHVEGATLLIAGQPVVELYDTPGLEDSIGLLDLLESLKADRRADDFEVIQRFLADLKGAAASGRTFAQEAKALRQVLTGDVALYVIDARDRVLGKHRDELEILRRCARPIVPVLNFTASPEARTAAWREHLARAGMHAVAEFDTVILDEDSERRLLEKMRTLLDRYSTTLTALIEDRARLRLGLVHASARSIADMLIDVAAHIVIVPLEDRRRVDQSLESVREAVRERERRCVRQLLEIHRFRLEDASHEGVSDLPDADGQWGLDLFNPAAMKRFGIRTGGGAAAGALAGLTIDVISHGLTLGAATLTGAAIGALLSAGQAVGRRLVDRARGRTELRVDDNTLRLLAARQTSLIRALLRRGHASQAPIAIDGAPARLSSLIRSSLPGSLLEARTNPHWSSLNPETSTWQIGSTGRQLALDALAIMLEREITGPQPPAVATTPSGQVY